MRETVRQNINYLLVLLTFFLFVVLGGIFLYATLYIWYMTTTFPGWEYSASYTLYVTQMNQAAFFASISLLVLLLLCIERRAYNFTAPLITISAALIAGGFISLLSSVKTGFFAAMLILALYQFMLAVLSLAGIRIHSEKIHRFEKSGSLLLHSGYALLAGAVGGLNGTAYEIPVFWLSTSLIISGTFLAFYSSLFNRSDSQFS